MNTQGKQLLASIKSTRNFLGDLSQLLMTADGLMGENSWESIWGSSALGELSYTVSSGHLWMPREATRPYRNKGNYPNVIAMVAVLLDDYQLDYKLLEPVVSASYFVFPKETAEEKIRLDFSQCRWFGWSKVPTNGTPATIDDSDPRWKPTYVWKYMQVFGQPLVEVTNETVLKEKVIDPLLRLIKENKQINAGEVTRLES